MLKQCLIALALVVVAIGGVLTYQYVDQGSDVGEQRARPPAVVNTVIPTRETVRDRVSAVGSLRALDAVELTTEVSGRVVELNLRSGQRAKEGELLLRLDDRQARADVRVSEAEVADARRQYDRARSLRSNNSISQSQVDELRTTLDVAQAQLEAAKTRLDNHRITAPFSGVVGLSDISQGAFLSAGTAVATLDSTERMELGFSVPERFIGQITLGQQVQGTTPAFPDAHFNGELVELGTRISELSRTLEVRALIDNPDGKLRPGQFMSASLTLREREALVIPEQAVLLRGADQYVFVAEDGKARRVAVTLGSRKPGRVEVAEGLTIEDPVIITGQDRLSSGDRIEVVEDDKAIPENRFATSLES